MALRGAWIGEGAGPGTREVPPDFLPPPPPASLGGCGILRWSNVK